MDSPSLSKHLWDTKKKIGVKPILKREIVNCDQAGDKFCLLFMEKNLAIPKLNNC